MRRKGARPVLQGGEGRQRPSPTHLNERKRPLAGEATAPIGWPGPEDRLADHGVDVQKAPAARIHARGSLDEYPRARTGTRLAASSASARGRTAPSVPAVKIGRVQGRAVDRYAPAGDGHTVAGHAPDALDVQGMPQPLGLAASCITDGVVASAWASVNPTACRGLGKRWCPRSGMPCCPDGSRITIRGACDW